MIDKSSSVSSISSYTMGDENNTNNNNYNSEDRGGGGSTSIGTSYMRPSTQLTEKILGAIANSVKTFRPSQSLAILSESDSQNSSDAIADIDLVISGGGLKFYHVMGSIAVLQKQFQQNKISIARVAGASAGAWAALFVIVKIPLELILESYHQCAQNPKRYLHEVYTEDLVILGLLLFLLVIIIK